jgi:hypothetical protein
VGILVVKKEKKEQVALIGEQVGYDSEIILGRIE